MDKYVYLMYVCMYIYCPCSVSCPHVPTYLVIGDSVWIYMYISCIYVCIYIVYVVLAVPTYQHT